MPSESDWLPAMPELPSASLPNWPIVNDATEPYTVSVGTSYLIFKYLTSFRL